MSYLLRSCVSYLLRWTLFHFLWPNSLLLSDCPFQHFTRSYIETRSKVFLWFYVLITQICTHMVQKPFYVYIVFNFLIYLNAITIWAILVSISKFQLLKHWTQHTSVLFSFSVFRLIQSVFRTVRIIQLV